MNKSAAVADGFDEFDLGLPEFRLLPERDFQRLQNRVKELAAEVERFSAPLGAELDEIEARHKATTEAGMFCTYAHDHRGTLLKEVRRLAHRVDELLAANNREVERRRNAENTADQLFAEANSIVAMFEDFKALAYANIASHQAARRKARDAGRKDAADDLRMVCREFDGTFLQRLFMKRRDRNTLAMLRDLAAIIERPCGPRSQD